GARYKETLTMGDFLETYYNHGSRRGDSTAPPFYYPESSQSGPDIVFVQRIDAQLYPVFVQTKCLACIYPGDVEKYMSLLYVYPTITVTPREGWYGDDIWDLEPEIVADHNQVFKDGDIPLVQLLMIIDGSNMREFVPEGVVNLFDSMKGVKRVHDQLDSSDRMDKKPMLRKQQK
ncbi:hypothetical protein BGZ97_008150, partial [Linnemannia gamsii]